MKLSRFFLFILILSFLIAGCKITINESCWIHDGETTSGSNNTVNGRIHIGENAYVKGECRSVNGTINVGSNSRVRDLATVNGNIRVGSDTHVKGDIQSVNGNVHCETGVKVIGCVETINGKIILERTSVEEDLVTYNGNIKISDNTIVMEDIVIKEKHGSDMDHRELKIEIDNSTVEGDILNEGPDTDVIVYLTNGGKVKGKVIDAKVVEE